MYHGFIYPAVFKGLHVTAVFTTKSFYLDESILTAQLQGDALYLPVQKHTDKVVVIERDMEQKIADAVVTASKGLIIGIKTADCVPLLLYDRRRHVAGAVHAGWRGTAEGILKETVEVFKGRFNSLPEDIVVAIGPGIRGGCYEVGPEVADAVAGATGRSGYITMRGERHFVDLPSANRIQALSVGIQPDNLWMSEDCTHCLPERYYSYRYSKGTTGRQYGFIVLQ